jgi:hypothetical protein
MVLFQWYVLDGAMGAIKSWLIFGAIFSAAGGYLLLRYVEKYLSFERALIIAPLIPAISYAVFSLAGWVRAKRAVDEARAVSTGAIDRALSVALRATEMETANG